MDIMKRNVYLGGIVRNTMKMHGKRMIFTNIYYNGTRTIKCYRDQNCEILLKQHLASILNCFGYKNELHYTFKHTTRGFIVKLFC